MAIPGEFFRERQGAAVLKHGILRGYLRPFASKVGKTAPNNRVVYLDAYAGPGQYEDGHAGSPAIASETADLLSGTRDLFGVYVERDQENVERLRRFLAGCPSHQYEIIEGEIEDHFDRVLELVGTSPVLALFDPFGLPVPMEQIRRLYQRAKAPRQWRAPVTEVIVNVSYSGIRRQCGHINSTAGGTNPTYAKAQKTILLNCDASLGGDWWREIAIEQADDWVERIANGYARRIHEVVGCGWFLVDVRDRPGAAVAYELLLASTYTDESHWLFNDVVSLANKRYREFNTTNAPPQAQTEMPLDERYWIAEIKASIVKLLEESDFVVKKKIASIYGSLLGFARETHVRTAIKELYNEGKTNCDGKGELKDKLVTRGTGVPRKIESKRTKAG